jgi:hypothetical protein
VGVTYPGSSDSADGHNHIERPVTGAVQPHGARSPFPVSVGIEPNDLTRAAPPQRDSVWQLFCSYTWEHRQCANMEQCMSTISNHGVVGKMNVPEVLADFTGMLRTELERAHITNWRFLHKRAEVLIENMRDYVDSTPIIDKACASVVARFRDYAQEIGRGEMLSCSQHNAKQVVLIAIDELEKNLGAAKPNKKAIALGICWT